jgi:predicted amidophosphoribosyltransferase
MSFAQNHSQNILHLGDYHPYWNDRDNGIKNPYFDEWSRRILALKKTEEPAIEFFFKELNLKIESGVAITAVPSHDPNKTSQSGICKLAQKLASHNRINATSCLKRHTKIHKLSQGGERSIRIHLESIHVENSYLIQNQIVYLLDDVSTSENSLKACRQLLLQAGAKMVRCIALGKTVRIPQEDEPDEF